MTPLQSGEVHKPHLAHQEKVGKMKEEREVGGLGGLGSPLKSCVSGWTKYGPGVSMTLKKWLVITQNHGVMDPFFIRVMETPGKLIQRSDEHGPPTPIRRPRLPPSETGTSLVMVIWGSGLLINIHVSILLGDDNPCFSAILCKHWPFLFRVSKEVF